MARVLLLLPTRTYRAKDFLDAATRLGVQVVVASEKSSTMESLSSDSLLTLDFLDPKKATEKAVRFHQRYPFEAIIPVDEETVVIAAAIGEKLGLEHNPSDAAKRTRLKHLMREALKQANVRSPGFRIIDLMGDPARVASTLSYPSVIKPVFLSASRGVMRVDDETSFVTSFQRLHQLLTDPELQRRSRDTGDVILVEDYVAGTEVALEGLLTKGRLETLAIFDKLGFLEGPYFEETLFVTPSRLSLGRQLQIAEIAQAATRAIGLRHGAVHVELRIQGSAIYVIEVAGRSVGGLCSRTLRFGLGRTLEEIVLSHAIGREIDINRESQSSGVMMIPIPCRGYLRGVTGLEEAKGVKGIVEVAITAHHGAEIIPLPEGASYLGFLFARCETSELVEDALRQAHRKLVFDIQ